ncbi:hypothetical protein FB45DRAFT_843444 [Roridomyces roridus]|uniref:BTB domain-containing protein n=1 Tax=Roridomyces roridus TaxID=1738132 RepID=A0AAD7B7E3_9AGAR|nr:hypothetical protein FB45DRAFT_843444 [Roridomyces roridus]
MATTTMDPQPLQRVDGLWFEDGNLVLQAENTQYRVYHGLLAASSPVFKDMMGLPRPPDSELVEGCPFVQLHDSAAETTVFLRAIFYASSFPPFPIQADFRTVSGCLRLGHKYQVDLLRRRALIHLSSVFDTQLERWDRITILRAQADSGTPPALDSVVSILQWTPSTWSSILVPAMQVAREADALWLLPDAFYNLSIAVAARSLSGAEVLHGVHYGGTFFKLHPQDQESFLVGHAMQYKSTTDALDFLALPADIPGCESREGCARTRYNAIGSSRARVQALSSHPLSVWSPGLWNLLKNLCPTCRDALEAKHKAARQAFWDKLPEIYGLPSWEELERMKVADIGTDLLVENSGS